MSDITLRVVGKMFSESEKTDKYAIVVTEGSGAETDRSELIAALRGPTTSVTGTTHTVTAADTTILVDDDTAGGAVTISLLAAATAGDNYELTVKKLGTTGNVVIDGSGSETIDGATTATLATQYESVTLVCNGSAYFIK